MTGGRSAAELAALRAERLARLREVAAAEPPTRASAVLRFHRPRAATPEAAPEAAAEHAVEPAPEHAAEPAPGFAHVVGPAPDHAPDHTPDHAPGLPAGDFTGVPARTPAGTLATPGGEACDLGGLPGAGPGLVWALRRAGISRIADLSPLTPEDLAARLGPIGRLAPAAAWIAAARQPAG